MAYYLSAQVNNIRIDMNKIIPILKEINFPFDNQTIKLPVPNMGEIEFKAIQNNTISGEFQSQFPQIRTYDIISVSDPNINGALTINDETLYASIYTPEGMLGIWPSKKSGDGYYRVYYGNSDPENPYAHVCCTQDESEHSLRMMKEWKIPQDLRSTTSSGEKLKTFKLVLICTGEFYEANGNSANKVNTLISAIVNAWNVILKKDLSIRLNLSQTPFLYSNKDTDPFIPDQAGGKTRTTQAVDAIHAKFSSGSYDIAHVLHNHHSLITSNWSSGGLAGVGVVCNNGTGFGSGGGPAKAAGWSGSFYNDDNDFVQLSAHEIGHQFNMLHTFNGTGESCTENISETTAYEIGSGTTIMSYNGVCGNDQNIPGSAESDNYYHINSLERAIGFIASTSCGTSANTNNNPPVPNAGNDYTIPKSTPFMLTGSATDANNDMLTYCWEQYDEDGPGTSTQGLLGSNAANNTKAPLFRSYPPSSSPVRYFPDIYYILQGLNKDRTFEALPSVSRTMKFRFTVRDNNNAGGGVSWDENSITVASGAGPFEMTSQNTATNLVTDGTGTFSVKWNVANTDKAPVNCTKADIYFSNDGGKSFPFFLASTANDGEQTIPVPDYSTIEGRIMVKGQNNIFFDVNNSDIKVQAPCSPVGASFTPVNNVKYDYNKSSNPSLDLNLVPAYGKSITKFSGSISSVDKPSNLVYFDQSSNQCVNGGNDVTYDIFKFYVSVSGSYTFENTGVYGNVMNFYINEYNDANLCNNMIGTNAIKPTGMTTVTVYNSVTLDLMAGKEYYFRISSFSPSFPTLPASYNVNLKTKPSGAVMYDNTPSPGNNYLYTFFALNSSNGKIHAISAESDFRSLLGDFGIYKVYGICVAKQDSAKFYSYKGKTLNELEAGIYSFNLCADLSSNIITIEIVAPKCDLNSITINNINCNSNSTLSDPADDFISFTMLAQYGSFTDTFRFVNPDTNYIKPLFGKFGTPDTFSLFKGSAGNGDLNLIFSYKKGYCFDTIEVNDPGICSDCSNAAARINEIHYENEGNDENEFIEVFIADPQPQNVKKYFIELYDGTSGKVYGKKSLDSFIMKPGNGGIFYVWEYSGIKDGSPDGLALIGECGDVMEFLSYEGQFTAVNGTASGLISNNIVASELPATPPGSSVQKLGNNWVYTVAYNTKGRINDAGPCKLISARQTEIICNNNSTSFNPADDYINFKCNPIGNQLKGKYKLTSSATKLIPEIADFGTVTNFRTESGTSGKGDITVSMVSVDSFGCSIVFSLTDPGNCSPDCKISDSKISPIKCNENSTNTNTTDDFLWFYLEPSGFNVAGKYTVEVSKGSVTPATANYGVKTYFNLQPGSAGGGDVELTIKDQNNVACIFKNTIKDGGPCSPNSTQENYIRKKLVTLYPNPARDILNMYDEGYVVSRFSITDILGRTVLTGSFNQEIYVSGLAKAVYSIRFYNKNNEIVEIQKFVKE
ncbi:MAG: reprolysin-like metallopeptidase [Deltaproteobacteria bacterium]